MQRNRDHYLPLLSGAVEQGDVSVEPTFDEKTPSERPTSTALQLAVGVSFISILISLFFHSSISSSSVVDISDPRFVASLRKVTPYPNLEYIDRALALKSAPKMWFPSYIVRANAEEPDRTYTTSSLVTLSPSDSMFIRWHMKNPANSTCYVVAAVPTKSQLQSGSKSYVSDGDTSAIEIWNVSYWDLPAALSWNTRPPRQSLMGTVNFTPGPEADDPREGRDGMELRPPTPLFDCGGDSRIAVEVACSDCKLNFEQIFSDPPMAFDVWVLE